MIPDAVTTRLREWNRPLLVLAAIEVLVGVVLALNGTWVLGGMVVMMAASVVVIAEVEYRIRQITDRVGRIVG